MIQLVYCSHAKVALPDEDLRTLLAKARTKNTSLGITGCLLHVEGAFLQVLEGVRAAVDTLFTTISRDPRHHRIITLLVRDLAAPQFPDWSMGFIDLTGQPASMVGYRRMAGFTDLVGDATRIRQIVDGFRSGRWRTSAA